MSKDRPLELRQLNLGSSENKIQPVFSYSFRFKIEIVWNCLFCNKSVRSGTNNLSVWGKTCCGTIYIFLSYRSD